MKKYLSLILCIIISVSLCSCASFSEQKDALVGTKWFSDKDTSNSILVWNFYDESVETASYFFDGNGIHDSEKKVGEYKIQKDAIKVKFEDSEMMIPYVFEDGKMILDKGKFFSPEDINKEIQGYWHLRDVSVIIGMVSTNEYNIQFDNGIMRIENAADAYGGAPGEYYYYGPYEGAYTIGDGTFETDAKNGNTFFFNVYEGKVNVFHYGKSMTRGEGMPGANGYKFN